MDGNKRTAFTALVAFLGLNGAVFAPSSPDATAAMLSLAAGTMDEAILAKWIRGRLPA